MERKTIFFNAKVEPVKPVNEEFTLCKLYVCALDKNRNFSNISKEAADDALPTLYNCPVIGHLFVDEQGNYHMGGHDMVIEQDKDGAWRFKSLCVPYGVIPQQDNVHYEEVEEPNGRGVKTYVVADCILWTGRFPELKEAIYSDKCWFGHSMEIGVKEHAPLEEDQNYTNILKYSYSALCLLGKSDDPEYQVEPCFPASSCQPYEFALNNAEFAEMAEQLKAELSSCFANIEKGGEDMPKEEKEIEAEKLPEQTGEFEIQEPTAPVADPIPAQADDEQPEAFGVDVPPIADGGTPVAENAQDEPNQFSATFREKREALERALPRERQIDDDGTVHEIGHWMCDFDDTYVFVERYEYTRDDGYVEQKGRYSYTFDDASKTATISGDFEEMFVRWLTKGELEQLETQVAEYAELVRYKESREKEDFEDAIDTAIEEFSDLDGNEEFTAVLSNKYSYASVDELKNACYIIRGKFSAPVKQRKQTVEPVIPIAASSSEASDPVEAFFARYGRKK